MAEFSHQQLQFHNPWWIRPELILEDEKILEFQDKKYQWHHPFLKSFPKDEYVLFTLRGPRQIGKTTLMKLIIKDLLLKDKEAVFFFPCDNLESFKELEAPLISYFDFARPRTKQRLFLLLDEICFVKEWQRTLKYFADSGRLKNTSVILSGSNILDLKFSSERLPGKRGDFFQPDIEVFPLTFKEFIPISVYERHLVWIEGDLHKMKKSEKLAYNLIGQITKRLTTPVSWYRLGREADIVSFDTVNEYLEILEKIFVLFPLYFFSLDEKKSLYRKNKKIYFTDPFILNALQAKIEGFLPEAFNYSKKYLTAQEKRPFLVENAAASALKRKFPHLYFGRGGKEKEIDFVGRKEGQYHYFEVKYQNQVKPEDFAWAKKFIKRSRLNVFSKEDYHQNKNLSIIPAEIFLAYENERKE